MFWDYYADKALTTVTPDKKANTGLAYLSVQQAGIQGYVKDCWMPTGLKCWKSTQIDLCSDLHINDNQL